MFKEWIVQNLYEIISTIVYPIIVFYFTKRHFQRRDLKDRDVNIESNQSEVVSKNLELYQRMLDDIEKRYEERLSKSHGEIEELEIIIKDLKTHIAELEKKLQTLSNQIINLRGKLEEYEKNSNIR